MAIITAAGAGETANGFLDISSGNFARGSKEVLLGMTAVNLSGRAQLLDERRHADLMKYVLAAGTAAVTVESAVYLIKGVKQRNVEDILKGSLKTGMGAAATAFIFCLDSRIIVVAHQATILALSSAQIAKLGISDLIKGRYRMGAAKLILGAGGFIGAASYAITAYLETQTPDAIEMNRFPVEADTDDDDNSKLDGYLNESKLTAKQTEFLEAHKSEIETMYANPLTREGSWTQLGAGASKRALEHPDFPRMIVKIPPMDYGWRGVRGEDDLIINYENYKKIKELSQSYDRIVIPESHLFQTAKGVIIVEEKIENRSYHDYEKTDDYAATRAQFDQFLRKADLCDIALESDHNAGIVADVSPPKISIFDFDCRNDQVAQRIFSNFNQNEFHIPKNSSRVSWIPTYLFTAGAVIQGAAGAAVKKNVKGRSEYDSSCWAWRCTCSRCDDVCRSRWFCRCP